LRIFKRKSDVEGKRGLSDLQFPAFMASQKDQKSCCRGFLGSLSMRTQK